MATRHQELPRLSIPNSMHMPNPPAFDSHQAVFSPVFPSAVQQPGFRPQFPNNPSSLQNPLQNPMQNVFTNPMQNVFTSHPQGAPRRASYIAHQPRPSMAHLSAVGLHPSIGLPASAVPMTPLGQQFPPHMMMGNGQQFGQQFPPRNRRSQSISLGGPPKAVLGGPARKLSPLPQRAANSPALAQMNTGKKVNVSLPKETIVGEDGKSMTRPEWARVPIRAPSNASKLYSRPPELLSAEVFPPEAWARYIPDTIDVFLPGKAAWDSLRQRAIEEKLEKLGVEKGMGISGPHIIPPHARAASISSPADPALLFFKLNKLQQSQAASSSTSLSSSPQPPHLSPSPNSLPPRFQGRHMHAISLAPQPSLPSSVHYNTTAALNPFGPNAVLGSDQIFNPAPIDMIHAPQGRVPVPISSLSAPDIARSRPSSRDSRPDFNRGFGLDIPEEDEEAEIEEGQRDIGDLDFVNVELVSKAGATEVDQDDATTVAHHSRHTSRLSATLSLRSVGGRLVDISVNEAQEENKSLKAAHGTIPGGEEATDEWTGSEDRHAGSEYSENESIGEWSNPSDEERARQQRMHRRLARRAINESEVARRIPKFPRPPHGQLIQSLPPPDDTLTNPSEDDVAQSLTTDVGNNNRKPSSGRRSPRPLPPLPHSRPPSDPCELDSLAHSRGPSGGLVRRVDGDCLLQPSMVVPRKDSLNPYAKPFVFGARPSGALPVSLSVPAQSESAPRTHSRNVSFSKPLNAAAAEFTPGGFNFRLPPGVPQWTFPASETRAPLLPISVPEKQGREKRQRRGSESSQGSQEQLAAFRFPKPDSCAIEQRSFSDSPVSPHSRHQSSFDMKVDHAKLHAHHRSQDPLSSDDVLDDTADAGAIEDNGTASVVIKPSLFRPKRTPIPLDFTHPISRNTVPAGLFKALVNGADERTRRSVRSRMSSRDVSDHMHRPSLDDLKMPAIARRASRGNLTSFPESEDPSAELPNRLQPRGSSLQSALDDSGPSTGISIPTMDISRNIDMQEFEHCLDMLLDEKIAIIRQELLRRPSLDEDSVDPSAQTIIAELIPTLRAEIREVAARGLEESQVRRGDLVIELIKEEIRRSHAEHHALLRNELGAIVEHLSSGPSSVTISGSVPSHTIISAMEQLSQKAINAVLESVSQLSSRLEQLETLQSGVDQNMLLRDLMDGLTPAIASLRPESLDYDYLTARLSQAVKPHISQLIDLASDKRETAGLIVDRILPLLPEASPVQESADGIVGKITSEIQRAIAPLDAFEIKEQVADLVVERLDSRLAVRDQGFNAEILASKVAESVTPLLRPLQHISSTLNGLAEDQRSLLSKQNVVSSTQTDLLRQISDLPSKLSDATSALVAIQAAWSEAPISSKLGESLLDIKSMMADLSGNKYSLQHSDGLMPFTPDVFDRLKTLPESLSQATNILQAVQADFALSRDSGRRELDDLKKINTDLQVQLAKARGAHGQIRVEKDAAVDKLRAAEAERDRLRTQVHELQVGANVTATELADIEKKNRGLDEGLEKALARLQAADVAAQASQERIDELAKANLALLTDKQSLQTKLEKLELQLTFANRDRESSTQALAVLQKQYDHLVSQQAHWDDLRHAAHQIDNISSMLNHADDEQMRELKSIRDRNHVLEGEHTALQKRFKDHESKIANSERALLTARQSLATANQRSSEWERRAKESEGKYELAQTQLDQLEQTHNQLEADHSLTRLQLEEKEAEERLNKDKEIRLREQVAALEGRLARLQAEVERLRERPATLGPSTYHKTTTNGTSPQARSSIAYKGVTPTPPRSGSTRSDTPPAHGSVWDSMHNPRVRLPEYTTPVSVSSKSRHSSGTQYRPPDPPSPTFSVVTRRDDGWWE